MCQIFDQTMIHTSKLLQQLKQYLPHKRHSHTHHSSSSSSTSLSSLSVWEELYENADHLFTLSHLPVSISSPLPLSELTVQFHSLLMTGNPAMPTERSFHIRSLLFPRSLPCSHNPKIVKVYLRTMPMMITSEEDKTLPAAVYQVLLETTKQEVMIWTIDLEQFLFPPPTTTTTTNTVDENMMFYCPVNVADNNNNNNNNIKKDYSACMIEGTVETVSTRLIKDREHEQQQQQQQQDQQLLQVTSTHMLVEEHRLDNNKEESSYTVLPLPSTTSSDTAPITSTEYVHTISRDTGDIQIFQLQASTSNTATLMATLHFDPTIETIVEVAYPNPIDTIFSRFTILGDDNVLVKYLNPNMMVICTLSVSNTSNSGEEIINSQIYVNIIDLVSANILQRMIIETATVPVRAMMMENMILVTYYNPKNHRSEVLSTGLYDGVIGKTDYLPFMTVKDPYLGMREHDEKLPGGGSSSSSSGSSSGGSGALLARLNKLIGKDTSTSTPSNTNQYITTSTSSATQDLLLRSSYLTTIPLVMQRTYILPRTVTALSHTLTQRGLTNKNIIFVMDNGEVYAVDFRLLHVRRPFTEPTQFEKEEGLMRYNAYVEISPMMSLTKAQRLYHTATATTTATAQKIISAPGYLESESIIMVYGIGHDLLYTTVRPSQGFDTLSADFNYTMLISVIVALAGAVMMLRNIHNREVLKRLWA
jgi:hypothetical protein